MLPSYKQKKLFKLSSVSACASFCAILIFYTPQAFSEQTTDPITKQTQEMDDNDQLTDNFNLKKHNSIYFIYGEPESKLQFSFKYEIFNQLPLYIGYTQLSYWNLKGESKPFTDVNYNPELFYTLNFNNSWIQSIDLAPYEHKSNGKAGPDSRSYERAYAQVNGKYIFSQFTLLTSVRAGYLYGDADNKDIVEYYGPVDLKFSITHFNQGLLDKVRLDFRIFAGGKYMENFDKGGRELGVSMRFGGANINPALYMQYYAGYAESLLNYNQYVEEWRVGFIL